MRKLSLALILAASLMLPQTALAWNSTGHMTVAYIAYSHLTANAKAQVDRLLQQHPFYPSWVEGLPDDPQLRGQVAFLRAATWPDDIKSDPHFFDQLPAPPPQPLPGFPDMLRHRGWHFIDIPFTTDNTPLVQPPPENAESKILEFGKAIGNPGVPQQVRAYDLPWLIHLTGDIHQPLHCVSRFTQAHPHGDGGGNAFLLNDPAGNLHSFWDDLLGKETDAHSIAILAMGIMNERSYQPSTTLTPQVWRDESVAIAKQFVYTVGAEESHDHPSVPPEYRAKAIVIARYRVAQAGYRLADLLNRVFP
jgi:S1/P1 Nuclease